MEYVHWDFGFGVIFITFAVLYIALTMRTIDQRLRVIVELLLLQEKRQSGRKILD
jgi:hypothetical protein